MISEEALLTDLKATYPGIHAHPLREYGAPGWTRGVCTGGEAVMPDGMPMFSTLYYGNPTYDGDVHTSGLQNRRATPQETGCANGSMAED